MKTKLLIGVLLFALTSCSKTEKDLCSSVVCNNGGTCTNGACKCPAGYSGTNCETAWINSSMFGKYKAHIVGNFKFNSYPPITSGCNAAADVNFDDTMTVYIKSKTDEPSNGLLIDSIWHQEVILYMQSPTTLATTTCCVLHYQGGGYPCATGFPSSSPAAPGTISGNTITITANQYADERNQFGQGDVLSDTYTLTLVKQ